MSTTDQISRAVQSARLALCNQLWTGRHDAAVLALLVTAARATGIPVGERPGRFVGLIGFFRAP
jgi:hypothetical protein